MKFGSSIFKESSPDNVGGSWPNAFDNVVAGRDGYGNWGYNLIAGDALRARFTPLTLSKVNFNGMRFDLATLHLKFTGLASRVERPNGAVAARYITEPFQPLTHFADDSTLLLGARTQADMGALQMGLNWVNQHVYQSTRTTENSLKGRLKPDQPTMDWIVVRFRDDSPDDGVGGAAVQDLQLVINDEARPDLVPQVISHLGEPPIQVGFVSGSPALSPRWSVAVEALLANDFLVDVAMLYTKSTTANSYADRLSGTYYQTVRRSKGNIPDLSNLRRVRFNVGENTEHFAYSADANLTLSGLEILAEYARSSVYSR